MTGKISWEAERTHLKFAVVFCLVVLGALWCFEKLFGWVEDRGPWSTILPNLFVGFILSVIRENHKRKTSNKPAAVETRNA